MSAILKMLEAADKATPGPWRIKAQYNLDDKDRTKIIEIIYEVRAGTRKGPFENKGWFHPDNTEYYEDELTIVNSEYTDDCSHQGGIGKQDAEFVTSSRNATADIQHLVSWVESAEHHRDCSLGATNHCNCGLDEIQSLLRSKHE